MLKWIVPTLASMLKWIYSDKFVQLPNTKQNIFYKSFKQLWIKVRYADNVSQIIVVN